MRKLRAISPWHWAGGVVFGLLVLAARLPDCIVVVRDTQGQSIGDRFDPVATIWTVSYVMIAVGCILFGGRIASGIGFVMLVVGIVIR